MNDLITHHTETKNYAVEKLAIKAGLLTCACFIVYFLLMKILDLAGIAELRILNLVILTGGVALTLRHFKSRVNRSIEYLEGMSLSFLTSIVSVTVFSLFIYIYFSQVDPGLLDELKTHSPMMGQYLSPFTAALSVMIEGTISSLIISFVLMQFYKDDPRNLKETNKEESVN